MNQEMQGNCCLEFECCAEAVVVLRLETFSAACQLVAELYRNKCDADVAARLLGIETDFPDDDLVLSNDDCLQGMRAMQSCCAAAFGNERSGDLSKELSNDYHDLFVGPHNLLAVPWSSVYLDKGKTLFGPTAMRVRNIFAQEGFVIPEDGHEPSDHVAYEWQFVADLEKRAAALFREGSPSEARAANAEASRFFEEFLKPWMPDFCERVSKGAKTDFYRGLAQFTSGFALLATEFFAQIESSFDNEEERRR